MKLLRMVSKTSFDRGRRLPLERTLNLLVATMFSRIDVAGPGTSRPSLLWRFAGTPNSGVI